MDLDERLHELRGRHTGGCTQSGICLGCRYGWHSQKDGKHVDSPECAGRRYRNNCPDYKDATSYKEEYFLVYEAELRAIFEKKLEYDRLRALGNAKKRRQFLSEYVGATEEELRKVESKIQELPIADDGRILKKLRWEL